MNWPCCFKPSILLMSKCVYYVTLLLFIVPVFGSGIIVHTDDSLNMDRDPNGVRSCSQKDYLCTYQIVDCKNHVVPVNLSQPRLYELRIDVVTPMFLTNGDLHHYLVVALSFMPKREVFMGGEYKFVLMTERVSDGAYEKKCFLFDFSKTSVGSVPLESLDVDRFDVKMHHTDFDFNTTYNFTLTHPSGSKFDYYSRETYRMPLNPEIFQDDSKCRNIHVPGNTQASKWYSTFVTIEKDPMKKALHLQFVAAPAGFCFESYEVVLHDKKPRSTLVERKNMGGTFGQNKDYLVGDVWYDNLDFGRKYEVSIFAVEYIKFQDENGKAVDKCVCPVSDLLSGSTSEHCGCIGGTFNNIEFTKMESVSLNSSITALDPRDIENIPTKSNRTVESSAFWIFVGIGIFLFPVVFLTARFFCRREGKKIIVHFGRPANGSSDKKSAYPTNIPLIPKDRTNVLIMYTHDSQPHDEAVQALALFLQNVLGFNVHLDQWEQDDVENNIMDYVSASIEKADRIVIVNSFGAYSRYQAKMEEEFQIERKNPGPLDKLFAMQIDQALGRQPCVLSVRFPYTPSSCVLPPLSVSLQYVLPGNTNLLLSALCKHQENNLLVEPTSEAILKMNTAISRMASLMTSDPAWFNTNHHMTGKKPDLLVALAPLAIKEDSRGALTMESDAFKAASESSKKSSVVQSEADGNSATITLDKADSGIHTGDDYSSTVSVPPVQRPETFIINPETGDEMKTSDVALLTEKNDSGFIGERRSINVYS